MTKHKLFARALYAVMALALVAGLTLVPATAVSALTSATVANVPETTSTAATYTIDFTTIELLSFAAEDTITITFPDDTYVPSGTAAYDDKVKVNDTVCGTDKVTGAGFVVTITVPKTILAGAVEVVIDKAAGVKNPTTVADNWKLQVRTSAEVVDVDSAVYSTVAPVPPTLTVDITEPADAANISKGQEFTVTAVVVNTGTVEATNVTANITTTGDASLTTGDNPQGLDNLAIGASGTATWTVTCDDVGAVTIEVTPAGKYSGEDIPEANLVSDSIGLTQQLPAALEVTAISAPPTVKVGEEFTVTTTLENTGEATATDVTLTVTPGTTKPVTDEDTGLVGNATATVFDFTLDDFPVVAGTLTVTANITTPGVVGSLSGMNYEKGTGTVTFAGPPDDATPILASYTGWVASTTESDIVSTSDNPVELGTLAKDATTEANFTLLCLALGDAFIKVEPDGNDANTGTGVLADNLQPNSAIVIQTEAAVLTVNITAPTDGDEVSIGDEITVNATVKNTGASTAKDVALTLSIDANAALDEGEVATQTVGYLALGDTSSNITWTVVCTAAGTSTITVTPSGIDVLTGEAIPAGSLIEDSVTVLQSVTTFNITLESGWNLISLPLIPTNSTITDVLADLIADEEVEQVRTFAPDLTEEWWIPDAPASTLSQIVDGRGYWIEVSAGASLIITGVDFALPGELPTTYPVVVGWNLIGFTSATNKTPAEYLGAVELTIQAIYGYDAATDAYFIPEVTTGHTAGLESGYGYWLAVNADGTIYP